MQKKITTTRFAPSPTGYLHLGHAYSAIFAENTALERGGCFHLRIENIDQRRCRLEYEDSIREDLRWLGLSWEEPVRRQSEHLEDYQEALSRLERLDIIYPCFCTRREILTEIERADMAPHESLRGPEGIVYPGTCRDITSDQRESQITLGKPFALRLDVRRALSLTGKIWWTDRDNGEIIAQPELLGDVVLARKDIPTSYHLSVTVDDYLQKVNLVTRGEDLRFATHIHRLLQGLLNYTVPEYRFHRLLKGSDGRRYSKRNPSTTIRSLREAGNSSSAIREIACR